MKCADALLLMLDADLAALSADHASPLGAHVTGCARCRAVIAALQTDTSRLAALMIAHPAPVVRTTRAVRRRSIWLAPIPLAAAAVLAYVGLSRAPSGVAPATQPSARDANASDPAAAPIAADATDPAAALPAARVAPRLSSTKALPAARQHPPAGTAATVVVVGRRSVPARIDAGGPTIAESVAPSPVAYDAGLTTAEWASVDVSTVTGRVVVLRPSNSHITVVWFY